jgi:Ala-tRNA(Pro) deacylase
MERNLEDAEKRVLEVLSSLDISWERTEHPPVYNIEEARAYWQEAGGAHVKNLFLRNYKGQHHYLVLVLADKKVDLKKLTAELQEDRLSFASPERLQKYLGLKPGAVSPFGLINDKERAVTVVVDQDLWKFDRLNFHPNVNTATITIRTDDFQKFLTWSGHKIVYLRLENAT